MSQSIDRSMSLYVEKAGPLALLQDAGRFGVRHLGMTEGGPMDWHAAGWANALLGNTADAPVLEITLGQLSLVAQASATLALAGADLGATLNDQSLAPWQRFELREGDRLAFELPCSGMRAYLAAPGGWIGQASLGSVACVTREGLGGHKGEGLPLETGDHLRFAKQTPDNPPNESAIPEAHWIDYRQPARLTLIPGGQVAAFEGRSLYQIFNEQWTVDTRADRMGIRLTGPKLACSQSSMISEGIAPGSVQVPADGQPICLMNDRQTIGGYPRIGTLTPVARARLAQCPSGHPVFLTACGTGKAMQEWRATAEAMNTRK